MSLPAALVLADRRPCRCAFRADRQLADPPAERLLPQAVDFEGVEDRVPLGFRDYAGLNALVKQVRSFPMAELERGRGVLSVLESFPPGRLRIGGRSSNYAGLRDDSIPRLTSGIERAYSRFG